MSDKDTVPLILLKEVITLFSFCYIFSPSPLFFISAWILIIKKIKNFFLEFCIVQDVLKLGKLTKLQGFKSRTYKAHKCARRDGLIGSGRGIVFRRWWDWITFYCCLMGNFCYYCTIHTRILSWITYVQQKLTIKKAYIFSYFIFFSCSYLFFKINFTTYKIFPYSTQIIDSLSFQFKTFNSSISAYRKTDCSTSRLVSNNTVLVHRWIL